MQKKKGISLIVLIITIIIMIILSGAIILTLNDSGIINKANETADSIEIRNEKEILQSASAIAQRNDVAGRLTFEELKKALHKVLEPNEINVMDDSQKVVVIFNKGNRAYEVDNSGKLEGPYMLTSKEYIGDLTNGGKHKGTEQSPYVISCIEDLVEFSANYSKYVSSYVILERDLDFNKTESYRNFTTTAYGDINGDGIINTLKTELTKQGEGCVGFKGVKNFSGDFNGRGNTISNLYQYSVDSSVGLFLSNSGTIQDLGLINITLTGIGNVGGVVAYSNGKILNCFVKGDIQVKGNNYTGVIAGQVANSKGSVEGCYSEGTLKIDGTDGFFGGIVGGLFERTSGKML